MMAQEMQVIKPVPFMPIYPMYARAYVPYQMACKQFPLEEALMKGTIYPELYQPYIPEAKRCRCHEAMS